MPSVTLIQSYQLSAAGVVRHGMDLSAAPDAPDPFPNHNYDIPYSDATRLNTLDVHTPRAKETTESQYWIVCVQSLSTERNVREVS